MNRVIAIVCNQAFTVLFGLISVKLISRLVSPAIYGPYALLLTLGQLSMTLSHAGLYNLVIRCWQREQGERGAFTRFVWGEHWRACRVLAGILAGAALAAYWFDRNPVWLWSLPVLFALNVSAALAAIGQGAANAEERQWRVFLIGATVSATRVLLPIGLVILAGASLGALVGGLAGHALVVSLLVIVLFKQIWQQAPPASAKAQKWSQELWNYGRPYFWMGIGGWLLQNADRWVVAVAFGEKQAGLFSMAASLGGVIPGLVAGGLLQLVFPKMFRLADSAKTPDDWRALARRCDWLTVAFLGISVAGLLVLSLIGPHLVGWLIGEKYREAMEIVGATGMGMLSVQVNQFHYLLLQGRQNSAAMVRAMSAVAGVKTLGSIISAAVSWQYFLAWQMVSVIASALVGRAIIRRYALSPP